MSDEVLPYYQKELTYIRKMGAEFARDHGKIAERLRLGPDECLDPHVERVLEGFAYLTARIRHKLDDEFPEVTDSILGLLYPHLLAPVPSMTVVELRFNRDQATQAAGAFVPKDATIETEAGPEGACTFRTCYPTRVWPVEVASASVGGLGFAPPGAALPPKAVSCLRIQLQCMSGEMTFSMLRSGGGENAPSPRSLRFYLKGQPAHVFSLYELIFNHCVGVTLAGGPAAVNCGPECLKPVGFETDEGLLPYSPRSFLGYRLLSEFFAFPRKFLFVDLMLQPDALRQVGNKLDIFIFLDRTSTELEQNVTEETIRLGCCPAVNLFPHRCEPIDLNGIENEYRIVPDARRPLGYEVWSIDRVMATSPTNEQVEFQPFFSFKHERHRDELQTFYYASRRPAGRFEDQPDPGTDLFLSLVDLDYQRALAPGWTLDVATLCCNRDLPRSLPFGGGQPHMTLADGGALQVECVTQPTSTYRPPLRSQGLWKLISQLSLNHLSIAGGVAGADALREILRLHEFSGAPDVQAKIDAIQSVRSQPSVGRVPAAGRGAAPSVFCRGTQISIDLDEDRFADRSMFLFACVLERFFALYGSVNSFTRLLANSSQRKTPVRHWPPRAAEQVLL